MGRTIDGKRDGFSRIVRPKHTIVGLIVAALCVSALAACGGSSKSSSSSKGPVTLALISYKVPGSDSLTSLTAGADVAEKQINAAGGFGGRKLNIITCNSMLSPAAATSCAHTTLAQHPVAEFGCELSWYAAGLALYAAAKIPSINCPDSTQDFTNPWSFGLNASAIGQQDGAAAFVCTMPNVHKVISLIPNLPTLGISVQKAYATLHACGKQTAPDVTYPLTAVDISPYVARVAAQKPDFVLFEGIGAQTILFFKALAQAGIPADHVAAPDVDFPYSTVLKEAGNSMNGAYAENQFFTWGDTSNPQIAKYLAGFKGSSIDPRDPTVQWGYSDVMFIYQAAKKIGFSKFNSVALANFMRTENNFPIPLGRALVNPGPKGFPQEKQPYIQISQWKNPQMVVVPTGPNHDGWVYGYK